MSATMARQGGRVQLEQSDMLYRRLAAASAHGEEATSVLREWQKVHAWK